MGLLAAASAVLAPRANIASDVDWLADAPYVDVDCDLEASFVPLLLGWDVARSDLDAKEPLIHERPTRRPRSPDARRHAHAVED